MACDRSHGAVQHLVRPLDTALAACESDLHDCGRV